MAAITQVKTTTLGKPAGEISGASVPWAIIGVPQPKWERLTYEAGGQGKWKVTYNANILIIIGRKDMSEQDAQSEQLAWADRIRAAFSNDSTLGGLCDECQVMEGRDNIEVYKIAEMMPQLHYILRITEQVTISSAAS